MNRLIVLGLSAFALGVGAMVAPGLIPFDLDRALVYAIGFVAFAQAYRALVARRRAGIRRAETPDPEVPEPAPVPGEDVHEAIGSLAGGRGYYRRNGLREAAVAVLTRYGGLTDADARAQLAEGTWTDDAFAAAHLGEDAPPVPLRGHLGRVLRRESSYELGRRRAIEAIAAWAGVSSADGGDERYAASESGRRDRTTESSVDDEARTRRTGHFRGVSAVALVAIGVGVAFGVAPVVLSGVVGVGFAAYARASSGAVTDPEVALSIERELDADGPEPGEPVEVTLTVRNESERPLPDLRVVDGVPAALGVVEGSPRLGTTLRAGEATTLSYSIEARRGVHEFDPVTVLARDLAGATEESRCVPVETTLTCVPTLRPTATPVPLRVSATQYAGRVQTATGGEGVEFHATRAYQPGDPTNRIDWNRRARTGELATLEFREERSATVVVIVDARAGCYLSHEPFEPHAVDRAVDAAGRVVASLLSAGDRVGVAAFGADCWLPPGSGRDHRARVRTLLATDPVFSSVPPEGAPNPRWRKRLARRIPSGAQLVVLTPLCDPRGPRFVRTFDAAGHPTTVISPDPTAADAPGPLLSTVARRVRITDLRGAGVPVIDWPPGESLSVALSRVAGRRTP